MNCEECNNKGYVLQADYQHDVMMRVNCIECLAHEQMKHDLSIKLTMVLMDLSMNRMARLLSDTLISLVVAGDGMTLTGQEENSMLGQIDRNILNLLFANGVITLSEITDIIKSSELPITNEAAEAYSEILVMELQKRFFDNVEVPLFSNNSDNVRLVMHEDAKWVMEQITQEEYDENGEVVAKVLPNFEMEEYQ
jgi:predicted transcriptional regulator